MAEHPCWKRAQSIMFLPILLSSDRFEFAYPMKVLFARLEDGLYDRFLTSLKARDLKLAAAVKQAVQLWLKKFEIPNLK